MKAPGTTGAGSKAPKTVSALDQAKAISSDLEDLMRKAVHAADCKDVAEFKRLPREDQNAFLAQARGIQSMPMRDGVQLYDPNTIRRSPFNRQIDRKSPKFLKLLDRIKVEGVLQNGIIRPVRPPVGKIAWELIAGERRWTAALMAGQQFPAAVRDCSDLEALELQAVENNHREDLNPIDEATKFDQLQSAYEKSGVKRSDAIVKIQQTTGKGESTIYERMSLLKLPPKVQSLVIEERLPASHAALITKVQDPATRTELANEMINSRNCREGAKMVSYREAERMVDEAKKREKNLADYQRQAEEFRQRGAAGMILKDAQLAKLELADHGSYCNQESGYVRLETSCHEDSQYRRYQELLGKKALAKLTPFLARTPMGVPVVVYAKAAILAELGGKIKMRSSSSSSTNAAEAARNRAHRRRGKEFAMLMSAVVKGVETTLDSSQFWRFFAHCLVRQWRSDPIRRMCARREWKREYRDGPVHKAIDQMGVGELRALCAEILLWFAAPNAYGKGWDESITEICSVLKVPLPAWTEKGGKAEVQASGEGEDGDAE